MGVGRSAHAVARQLWSTLQGSCAHARSCRTLCDPWTAAHGIFPAQLPLSLGFSHLEYAVGCHFLLQGHLPVPEIKPAFSVSPAWQADSLSAEPLRKPRFWQWEKNCIGRTRKIAKTDMYLELFNCERICTPETQNSLS